MVTCLRSLKLFRAQTSTHRYEIRAQKNKVDTPKSNHDIWKSTVMYVEKMFNDKVPLSKLEKSIHIARK